MLLVPALRKKRQEDCKLKARLEYIVEPRPSWISKALSHKRR